ncbi:hypothetical protein T03_8418 [Trichinella britovi]|uniref:Uncharacterized protein n=1 Tax=Trichinella britovi TaxID=45882 RepID=A0A0V1C735_TRIBR|nr:hypothetical protein T03_8418 [Trichinella britovi]
MQFFLTLRVKEKHQNRRKRNLRVPLAATKQFSDDVIHCYEEQNAGMYSDIPVLFNGKNLHNNAILRNTSDAEDEEVKGYSAISATLLSF